MNKQTLKFLQKNRGEGNAKVLNDFLPNTKTERIGLNNIMPHHSKV